MAGMLFSHWALFTTPDLGIKGIYCLTPVLSTVLLAIFRGVDVRRPDLLLVGLLVIVASNALMGSATSGLPRVGRPVRR